jgi:peptide/nickel transport system ATP-binding protein
VALLEIDNLAAEFSTESGTIRAVDGLSLAVESGETLAVVGESGSGKSVTALSVLRLVPPSGRIVIGAIRLEGDNLIDKSEREMRAIRGNRISMIFQEPMSSLNPAYTIGQQIAEPFIIHRRLGAATARQQALQLLRLVQIAEPERRLDDYPHELSGGMRQRVMIAIALACRPVLLIADEPTTALDVTIQAQILDLMRDLQAKLGMAILLITHDFGVVAEIARRVAVMYAGRIIEQGPVAAIFDRPLHPYTRALMSAVPRLGSSQMEEPLRLSEIGGTVVTLTGPAIGCSFRSRCPLAMARCHAETPLLRALPDGHGIACHKTSEMR